MPKHKVVVIGLGYPTYEYEEELLREIDAELVLSEATAAADVAKAVADADAILNRTVDITADTIDAMTRCKVISRYGIGVDNIDIAAATKKGIIIANVPDYCWEEVSDQALALLMSCARKTVSHDKLTRKGGWDLGASDPMYRIAGKTLGLLGLGNIARRLATKVAGFGLRIIAFDPYIKPELAKQVNAELVDLDTLFRESDYVSVHCPVTPETRNIVNEENLRKMKKTAILVNTSRGALVDEAALYRAVKEGWINGAGVDVFVQEPPPADHPFFELDNMVVSDHAAWYSEESQVELQTKACAEVVRVLKGGLPKSLVNPDVKKVLGVD